MKRFVPLFAALAFASGLACGEPVVENGSISGTVTDSADAAVAGVSVSTDPVTVTATTDAAGAYTLADIAPGTYKVIFTADGYLVSEVTGVAVVEGEAATADATLVPAVTGGAIEIVVNNVCTSAALAGAQVTLDGSNALDTASDGTVEVTELEAGDYTVRVSAYGFLPSETTATVTEGTETTVTVDLTCQTKAVFDMAAASMADVPSPFLPITKAQALFDNLNDANTDNDPVVVSVRSAAHYALGHVPGAVNMPWKQVASDAAIELFGAPGTEQTYTAYCYTGHTGGIATAVMNILGYKTQNMKYGIGAWTADESIRVAAPFDDSVDSHDFDLETTINEAAADNELPELAFDGVETPFEAAKAAADAYLNREGMAPNISAADLHDLLYDGDDSNDPVVVSVRAAADYAVGHIPGAINIPWTQIAVEENLKKLPTDRKIVVYCYTGHTGAHTTGILGTLGYDVSNLKFGFDSWSTDEAARGTGHPYHGATDLNDFAVTVGETP